MKTVLMKNSQKGGFGTDRNLLIAMALSSKKSSRYRFYGNNIKSTHHVAVNWEEGDFKQALVYTYCQPHEKVFFELE